MVAEVVAAEVVVEVDIIHLEEMVTAMVVILAIDRGDYGSGRSGYGNQGGGYSGEGGCGVMMERIFGGSN